LNIRNIAWCSNARLVNYWYICIAYPQNQNETRILKRHNVPFGTCFILSLKSIVLFHHCEKFLNSCWLLICKVKTHKYPSDRFIDSCFILFLLGRAWATAWWVVYFAELMLAVSTFVWHGW